jgi:hypothetical protein
MKKYLMITAAIGAAIIMAGALLAADAKQTPTAQASGGGGGQEVVVKGQLKIKIESPKPEIPITTDANEVANAVVKTEEEFMSLSPEDIKDIRLGLPEAVTEERPEYHPSLFALERQPIFNLVPRTPAGVDIEKWNFKVTDPTGSTVKLEKGGGSLPDKLVWDGLDQNGQILKLNAPYMYTLTFMDRAGNPGSVRSQQPKEVQAIKYYRNSMLVIEASNNLLFDPERKDRFTDRGKQLLDEISDYIKMSNKFPIEIQVYSEDEGLAKDQADSLMLIFDKTMKIPRSSYNIKPIQDNSVPKNYRIVFLFNS